MPIERREITLSAAEIEDAVTAYVRTSPTKFPTGRIASITPADNGQPAALQVGINPPNAGDQILASRIEGADLTELLIRFCLENNIPVPRAGRKKARVASGAVSLLITVDRSGG